MHFTCHTLTTDFRQSVMRTRSRSRLRLRMGLATPRAKACRIPYAPDRKGTWRTYCWGTQTLQSTETPYQSPHATQYSDLSEGPWTSSELLAVPPLCHQLGPLLALQLQAAGL